MRASAVWFAIIVSTCIAVGQQQIPNAGLDEWTLVKGSSGFKDYEEPSQGWTSGNGVIHIAAGADPVCERSTDAYSGAACAKLTTRRIFGQIASGSLYLGVFRLDLSNPASSAKRGIPFAGPVPTRFRGWYRYAPVGSDSAAIYAMFTKWDGSRRVVLGEARLRISAAVPTWTAFDVAVPPLAEPPDSMSVVAASSAGGENFRGDAGSTLWVDDLSFAWEAVSVSETTSAPVLSFDGTMLHVQHTAVSTVLATDLRGRTERLPMMSDGRAACTQLTGGVWLFRAIAADGRTIASTLGIVGP